MAEGDRVPALRQRKTIRICGLCKAQGTSLRVHLASPGTLVTLRNGGSRLSHGTAPRGQGGDMPASYRRAGRKVPKLGPGHWSSYLECHTFSPRILYHTHECTCPVPGVQAGLRAACQPPCPALTFCWLSSLSLEMAPSCSTLF